MNREWEIFFSKNLNMKIALDKNSGDVFTEDMAIDGKKKVDNSSAYTYSEIQILAENGFEIDTQTHICKKIMKGRIVECAESKRPKKEKLGKLPEHSGGSAPQLESWEKKQESLF